MERKTFSRVVSSDDNRAVESFFQEVQGFCDGKNEGCFKVHYGQSSFSVDGPNGLCGKTHLIAVVWYEKKL